MSKKSKAELFGLIERIVQMSNVDHLSCEDIEQKLRAEGYDISREAIRRTVKSNKSIADELMKTREETMALVDAIRDNPGTDINEATLDFLISKAFEFTKSIEAMNFKDLPELATFVSRMTRAKTQLAKLRLDHDTMFEKIRSAFMQQLREELKNMPDLCERIQEVAMRIKAEDV